MGALFLASFLVFSISLVNLYAQAQARTFPDCNLMIAAILSSKYGRPPSSPFPSPRSGELSNIYHKILPSPPPPPIPSPSHSQQPVTSINYGRAATSPPPPPKPSSPIGQLEINAPSCDHKGTRASISCKNYISMVTDYGKTARSPLPPPKPATPSRPETLF